MLAAVGLAFALIFGQAVASSSAVASSRWEQLVPRAREFESDGERFVAWQVEGQSPIVVLDTLTGRRVEAPGCNLFIPKYFLYTHGYPAAHGRFLVECNETEVLLDGRTGAVQRLPQVTGVEGRDWDAVGTHYLEGQASPLRCRRDRAEKAVRSPCIALLNIATGTISYRPRHDAGDLDRQDATVCPALRAKANRLDPLSGDAFDGELFAEPGSPLRIWRCHGAPLEVPGTRLDAPGEVNIAGGRLISWDTGHYAPNCLEHEHCEPHPWRGNVYVYSVRSGRSWKLRPPTRCVEVDYEIRPCGVFGYSAHTDHLVYWVATRTVEAGEVDAWIGASTVYETRL